jgi:putative ABC transport system substrate-binding protein
MRLIGLVVVLAASLALTPVDGGAQQRTGIPRIGVLRLDSPQGTDRSIAEFSHGLRELGYLDRQNIALEIRWAEHKLERLPALAADLVRLKVDVMDSWAGIGRVAVEMHAKATTSNSRKYDERGWPRRPM